MNCYQFFLCGMGQENDEIFLGLADYSNETERIKKSHRKTRHIHLDRDILGYILISIITLDSKSKPGGGGNRG